MKQYHLLPDQSVQPMPRGDHVLNFSDAEDLLTDEDLKVKTFTISDVKLMSAFLYTCILNMLTPDFYEK